MGGRMCKRLVVWGYVLVLGGCGGAGNPTQQIPEPSDRDRIATWNAAARSGAVTETLHGVDVSDPYRALEEDTEATRAWIEAQTRRTEEMLADVAMPGAEGRIRELLSIGTLERPAIGGDSLFYMSRSGDRERSALYRRASDGTVTLLVAPETWAERAAIDWFYPSPGGTYVAFGVSDNGDERSTLHVVHTADGTIADDTIARTKWSTVAWLHDDSGFYYTRYPAPGEASYDAAQPESYFPRVFFHRLGTDSRNDTLVWGAPNPTDFPWVNVSNDDRTLVLHNMRGWSASDVYVMDRGGAPASRVVAPDATHPLRTVIDGFESLSDARVVDDTLYLHTNLNAPRGRIVCIPLAHVEDRSTWTDLVPEDDGPIEDWALTKSSVVVHRLKQVASTLDLYPRLPKGDRKAQGTSVSLPSIGALGTLDADVDSEQVVFDFSSFFLAPTLYEITEPTLTPERLLQVDGAFDATRFVLERETVPSADGTPVNVYVMHDARALRDANNPVLLYGYGGFNVSLLPSFSRSTLYWLERGGVYAVANLRGGGEFGEAWHRAGMRDQKQHVFEDFEAVIAWMSDSKWSRPERIAIQGGSNGGLLMGAMLTRVPETFGAAVAGVGLYDMVRYTLFPPAALWASEYGDPTVPSDFVTLHSYSPYHRVRDGIRYPFSLIETADHDTRVHWAHSTKFAGRLQDAALDPTRIHFYMEKQLGHGRGVSLQDQVRKQLRTQAFLTRALGM